ncbi:hypothetical protein [Sinanaerobacter chloroacetimidivorans]|uniref:Uncharacterized protein n=1 Tax=Sinanaerobacter chloroacetimidivorans TaxID=2818044 RepID=A0A8J7W1X7_9FIRM|nr:hypothetical protein [Sinanaerobacter chloroacetimidivorans]MBR0597633.1 hypothetical protein [Sinanaerobacter chloroacetimidivorans]
MNPLLILIVILIFSNQGGSQGFNFPMQFLNLPLQGMKSPVQGLKFPPFPGKAGGPGFGGPGFGGGQGPFFDTFKMELLLDRLHTMTNTLEKVNHLNQMRNVPLSKDNAIDRIQESLDAARGFLYDSKSTKKLDTIASTLTGVKKLGDIENLMGNIGPILSMLSREDDK